MNVLEGLMMAPGKKFWDPKAPLKTRLKKMEELYNQVVIEHEASLADIEADLIDCGALLGVRNLLAALLDKEV